MVAAFLAALALAAMADARLPERILHFPKERAVGSIRVQHEDLFIPEVTLCFHPGYAYAESEFLSFAQGDVRVPAGRRVFLTVGGTGAVRQQCLEALQSLDPNALYSLSFMSPMRACRGSRRASRSRGCVCTGRTRSRTAASHISGTCRSSRGSTSSTPASVTPV